MTKRCKCGCCHVPDHGACQTFEAGMNGRCVYCDHGIKCHPGKKKEHNTPLGNLSKKIFTHEQFTTHVFS